MAAVVITRPLPGLNVTAEDYALPECSEEEFLSIASRVAGREVKQFEIPFREYQEPPSIVRNDCRSVPETAHAHLGKDSESNSQRDGSASAG